MEHSYIFNPFTGIICTICKLNVCGNGSLVNVLYKHQYNSSHTCKLTKDQCRAVVDEFEAAMEGIAKTISSLSPTEVLVELLQFLVPSEKPLYYCSECGKIVDRDSHMGKRHKKYCIESKTGYMVRNCVGNDPKVIEFPLNINLPSNFCPLFWQKRIELLTTLPPTGNQPIINEDPGENVLDNAVLHVYQSIIHQQGVWMDENLANRNDRRITVPNQRAEPNLWQNRVGFQKHLQGYN
jgi:hypothetical protein